MFKCIFHHFIEDIAGVHLTIYILLRLIPTVGKLQNLAVVDRRVHEICLQESFFGFIYSLNSFDHMLFFVVAGQAHLQSVVHAVWMWAICG